MNNKQISNNHRILRIQQWLVLIIVLFILLPATFVFTTDGLIKNFILNNFTFFYITTSHTYFYNYNWTLYFFFNDNQYTIKIKTKCRNE